MAATTLNVDIEYDPDVTDPESLACAMDRLIETILSTPGILDEYGNPRVEPFFVARQCSRMRPRQLGQELRRWVIYDLDTMELLTTRVYDDYEHVSEDASLVTGAIVVPLILRGVRS